VSFKINNQETATNNLSVTLTLDSENSSEMYVTQSSDCATGGQWEDFASSKSWTLFNANASNTIYIKNKKLKRAFILCSVNYNS